MTKYTFLTVVILLFTLSCGKKTPLKFSAPNLEQPEPVTKVVPGGNPGISYDEVKARILTPYRCTSCHSVGTETKLARWMNIQSPAGSKLYTYSKSGSMPKGGNRVTTDDLAFILQYAKDFAARN